MTYPDANNPFKDLGLWNNLIKPQLDAETGARFCLFSCYGSTDEDYSIGTPPVIPRKLQISLLPFPNGQDFGLYLDKSEFYEVIGKYGEIRLGKFKFDGEACEYIYYLTMGHVGMVRGLISFFQNVSSTVKSPSGSTSFTYSQVALPPISQDTNYFDINSPTNRSSG